MNIKSERSIKIGLIITPVEDRDGTATPRWKQILSVAKMAEEVGFDSIWISDHLIHRFSNEADYGIWECWSLVSALAACTTRVQIGTWVLCSGFRNPALFAKMEDTVDEISGGRLIVGIGSGWHKPEYDAFGFPFENRVSRFEEAITIIHGLLRSGHIDFDGRFYRARDCELRPRGPRVKGAPIMIGTIGGTPLGEKWGIVGNSSKMLEITARYADIWNCPWINDPAVIPPIREMVDRACLSAGRAPSTLLRSNGVMLSLPGWEKQPGIRVMRTGRAAMGAVDATPEEHAHFLRRFAANGVHEVHISLDPETPDALEKFSRTIELLDEQ